MVRWRVAALLKQRGITPYRLADISGIHRTQAYRLARGSNAKRLDVVMLDKLCAALDVQPGDLLEYVRDRPVSPRPRGRRARS